MAASWIRWSGLAAVLGGVLWALWYVGAYFVGWGSPSSAEYGAYEAYNRSMPGVLVLLLAGLVGAHMLQRKVYGWLGKAGFVVASIGLLGMIAGNVAEFWIFTEEAYGTSSLRDNAWMAFGLGLFAFYAGSVLFGIATLRASILPRPGALLLLIWFPAGFVMSSLLQLVSVPEDLSFLGLSGLCGLGWAILGYALWSGGDEAARQPARVR